MNSSKNLYLILVLIGLGVIFLGISFFLGYESSSLNKNELKDSASEAEQKYSHPQRKKMGSSEDASETTPTSNGSEKPGDDALIQLQSRKKDFVKCYNLALRSNPKLKGDVKLEFFVKPSGKIENIEIKSESLKDMTLNQCLKETLSRNQLKPFKGDAFMMVLPLSFE